MKTYIKNTLLGFLVLFTVSTTSLVGQSSWSTNEKELVETTNTTIKSPNAANAVAYYSSNYFATIEAAVNSANNSGSSQTVYVIPGVTTTINNDITITSGITLCLPYTGTKYDCGTDYGSMDTKQTFANSSYRKTQVKLKKDKRIVVESGASLYVGGIAGTQGQGLVGLTRGDYCEIVMQEGSSIECSGTLRCFGFIRDESESGTEPTIKMLSGSNALVPLTLYDYKGGTHTKNMVQSLGVFPFSAFDFPNFQTKIIFYSGSSLVAKLRFKASLVGTRNDDINILGSSTTYLLSLTSGTAALKYTPEQFGVLKEDYSAHTDVLVDGSLTIGTLSMQGYSTESFYLPISSRLHIYVNSGSTLTCPFKTKIMSGSLVNIRPGAVVNVTNNVIVYSTQLSNSGTASYHYPFKSLGPAKFINGGTLNIKSGGQVAGLIDYSEEDTLNTGIINITNSSSIGNLTITEGLDGSTSFDVTESCRAKLRLTSDNISEANLSPSSIYTHHINHWDGNGCSYEVEFINLHEGTEPFDESNISNNSYPSIISDAFTLPEPQYANSDYAFGGFYCETTYVTAISVGSHSAGDISSAFDLNTHKYTIYVRWVSPDLPKAYYKLNRYDGGSSILEGISTIAIIGSSFNSFPDDTRMSTLGDSTISLYYFTGWEARVYTDNTLSTQVGNSIAITNGEFAFNSTNGIQDNYYVIFSPSYTTITRNAPQITVTGPSGTLGASATSSVTATVTNYDASLFRYTGGFVSGDEEEVIVSENSGEPSVSGTTATYSGVIQNTNTSNSTTGTLNVYFVLQVSITIDGVSYSNNYQGSCSVKYSKPSCLLPDTLITMADGTQKAVKDIQAGDMVLVFNHETGQLDVAPITFNDHDEAELMRVLNINFSNGKTVSIIDEHGFFDLNTMKYEYIREDNYQNFIGHSFYVENGEEAVLTSVDIREEYTECYSPTSFFHFNYFTEGMLSMPGGITGLFNIFEYGQDLKYDEEAYNRDIDTYGLFTYEDLAPLGVTEIMFEAYAGKYLKVALGKGILTEEYLMYLIERYGGFTD